MKRLMLMMAVAAGMAVAAEQVLVLTTDGQWIEGATKAAKVGAWPLKNVLSLHNGAAATGEEAARIAAAMDVVLGKDRKGRDVAVEQLSDAGLAVLTPLLAKIRDTDQHEPKPLYNLFGRLLPSTADQLDRTAALVRLAGAEAVRGKWPEGSIDVAGKPVEWSKVRLFAVKRKLVTRTVEVHSLRHSTQIEYFDTGVRLASGSEWTVGARGFSRLSWHQDEWATGPNGLTKPAGNYKTNLVDGHPFGALVGRVGAGGEVLFVGVSAKKTAASAGRLQLAINDNGHWQNNLGSYRVTVSVKDAYDVGEAQ